MNIQQLEEASAAYYQGSPIFTDQEFDNAVRKLRESEPDNPFLKRIGAPVPGTVKAKHKIPMGSLDNVHNIDEFAYWIPADHPDICLSHKLDGLSLELIYQNGLFIQAITRGNGNSGEDVTKNVLKSGNIPLSIDPSIISVRCECLIRLDDWGKYFEGEANPRNSAAGTIRRHDGHNSEYLRFYAFNALCNGIDEIKREHHILLRLGEWFDTPGCMHTNKLDKLIAWYGREEARRDRLSYEIDGVVAKINDLFVSEALGVRDGRPRGQIAIKFKPRGAETVLQNVVWQVGQTGALTPVGKVAPVGVGGTTVKSVTLCNIDEINRLGIAIGDVVEIIRAADVIPKLRGQVQEGTDRKEIQIPNKCPECGGEIIRDGVRVFCNNDYCYGKAVGRIMSWIKKRNILNLGIGIVKATKIDSICQLYKIRLGGWADIRVGNGVLGAKRAIKIMEELKCSMTVSLSEFLGSIGIKGVGRSLCRDLCDGLNLNNLEDVFAVMPDEICGLDGFDRTRACDFCNWMRGHRREVENLARMMSFGEKSKMDKTKVLDGAVVVFTGKSPLPRKEMSAMAERAGATVGNSISAKTTILVIADSYSMSSKAVKAREADIRLIAPEDFLEIIK